MADPQADQGGRLEPPQVPEGIRAILNQPIREDPKAMIEKLPIEITQHLAGYLTLDSAALLALCSRTLAAKLGTQYWSKIRPIRISRADTTCSKRHQVWFGEHESMIQTPSSIRIGCRMRYRCWCPLYQDNPHYPPEYQTLVDFFLLLRCDLGPSCYFCVLCTCLHFASRDLVPFDHRLCSYELDCYQSGTPYGVNLYDNFAMTISALPAIVARLRSYGTEARISYPKMIKFMDDVSFEYIPAMTADVETRLLPDDHVVIRTQEWLGCERWAWNALAMKESHTLADAMDAIWAERWHDFCVHPVDDYTAVDPDMQSQRRDTIHYLCRHCPTEVRIDFWAFRRLSPIDVPHPKHGRAVVLTTWRDLGMGISARDPAWRAHVLKTSHPNYPAELRDRGWEKARFGYAHPAARFERQPGVPVAQLERKKLKELRKGPASSTLTHRGYRPLVKRRFPLDWPPSDSTRWTSARRKMSASGEGNQ